MTQSQPNQYEDKELLDALDDIFEHDESWRSNDARLYDPALLTPKLVQLITQKQLEAEKRAYKQGWDSAGGELVGVKQDMAQVERAARIDENEYWYYKKQNAPLSEASTVSMRDFNDRIAELQGRRTEMSNHPDSCTKCGKWHDGREACPTPQEPTTQEELKPSISGELKRYFEANCNDGEPIQRGTMLNAEYVIETMADFIEAEASRRSIKAREDEQKLVTEWLTDAEHVGTIREFNQLRRMKLESERQALKQ